MFSHDLLDGIGDIGVCSASAKIAAHQFADLVARSCASLIDEPLGRADLAWSAVAALECVMINECLLEGMKRIALSQALDRGDSIAIMHDCQTQAAVHPPAVDQYRAGPALTVIAAFLGAYEVGVVAQKVEESDPWQNAEFTVNPVDRHADVERCDCRFGPWVDDRGHGVPLYQLSSDNNTGLWLGFLTRGDCAR